MTRLEWRSDLSDADQRAIRDVIAAASAADGVAPVGDQVLRALPGGRTGHLVALHDDELVGYLNLAPATADDPAMAEAVVHPRARRQGIGSRLVGAGLDRGGAGARIWAHGDLPPARTVAAALDLVAARELWQMRRGLADLPPVPASPGATLRGYAGPDDDAEVLRVNNAAFAWHPEQGGWTERDLADRRAESWFDPAGFFLAFQTDTDGTLLGFHWTKIHEAGLGEVYVVAVDPAAQGRGLGRTLVLAGLHHLAARLGPDAAVLLYVEANNSAAIQTYRRLGFEVANTDVAYTRR